MSRDPGGLYSFEGRRPVADASAFIAPGARVIGRTTLAAHTSVWFNAVLRADYSDIEVGEGSNVQDLTMVHVEAEGERGPGSAERGVRIGQVGTTGRVTGPHLHYEVHVNGTPVDGRKYISD